MVPGIDPKVDIAFKRVFGSPPWRHLTMALIDAVLQPLPWNRLTDLEFLNPSTDPLSIDDKLSILDIKARDGQGRLYNIEMQMVANVSLPQRFLYYWSQLYTAQLSRGDEYSLLNPAISICIVNDRLFNDSHSYHRRFRLLDAATSHILTEDLDIHLLELANFTRPLDAIVSPLDFWLYFLKNGVSLDADALPAPLNRDEIRQAMEVLKVFSQDEMARELYEARLKAQRDAKMHERAAENALALLAKAKRELTEVEKYRAAVEQQRAEAEQQTRCELVRRINLCERILAQPITHPQTLLGHSVSALREKADALERELP